MPVTAKPYWESALHRLRLALANDTMSNRMQAGSQERVLRYREQLERAAVRSKSRSSSFRTPGHALPNAMDGTSGNYRALMIDAQGRIVRSEAVAAAGDAEAKVVASALADGHAVDLWDGLRFIEHFDPA